MPVSLSGLVISSIPGSLYATLRSPSMFYATLFFVAVVVIAYLTNPSDATFRTFLTEQSFRHYLTRLDDSPISKNSTVYYTARHPHSRGDSSHPQFHFANRASLVIRTPSRVYHNFGLFTIALLVPSHATRSKRDSTLVTADAWFLGAFGNWWRGGALSPWWIDAVTRFSDEESESGVLNFKNLDTLDEYNVLPFSSFQAKASRSSPPKLRQHHQQQDTHDQAQNLQHRPPLERSTTPPPLPKSVSLPLHTTRHPTTVTQSQSLPSNCAPGSTLTSSASVATNMFDQSPTIVDLLRQINASRSAVHELHSQLVEFQNSSAQQREALQQDLEVQRERKREEDSTKLELKSKTKSLEDSKRSAESSKREVDKKLKTAEARRDGTLHKLELLQAEISKIKEKMDGDLAWIKQEGEEQSDFVDGEREKGELESLQEELSKKKEEVMAAEDVADALSVRAEELEDMVAEEKERLTVLKDARLRKLHQGDLGSERELSARQGVISEIQSNGAGLLWPPAYPYGPSALPLQSSNLSSHSSGPDLDVPPLPDQSLTSPPISGSVLGLAFGSNDRPTLSNFAPFDNMSPISPIPPTEGGLSTPANLVPNSLINALHGGTSAEMEPPRSFQSDNDSFVIRLDRGGLGEWRRKSVGSEDLVSITSSPFIGQRLCDNSLYEPRRGSGVGGDHLDAEFRPSQLTAIAPSNAMDSQRVSIRMPSRTNSVPLSPNTTTNELVPPRRWFSVKEKKSLNPQAEEFNLNSSSLRSFSKHRTGVSVSFDALNPSSSSLASSARSNSSTTTNTRFFSRAFAPSPAERAALGMGTLNGSLEKLPSLSDVGSLKSSPVHVHAVPTVITPQGASAGPEVESSLTRSMAWLNSLPRRKPKFSPWEDDEH